MDNGDRQSNDGTTKVETATAYGRRKRTREVAGQADSDSIPSILPNSRKIPQLLIKVTDRGSGEEKYSIMPNNHPEERTQNKGKQPVVLNNLVECGLEASPDIGQVKVQRSVTDLRRETRAEATTHSEYKRRRIIIQRGGAGSPMLAPDVNGVQGIASLHEGNTPVLVNTLQNDSSLSEEKDREVNWRNERSIVIIPSKDRRLGDGKRAELIGLHGEVNSIIINPPPLRLNVTREGSCGSMKGAAAESGSSIERYVQVDAGMERTGGVPALLGFQAERELDEGIVDWSSLDDESDDDNIPVASAGASIKMFNVTPPRASWDTESTSSDSDGEDDSEPCGVVPKKTFKYLFPLLGSTGTVIACNFLRDGCRREKKNKMLKSNIATEETKLKLLHAFKRRRSTRQPVLHDEKL